MKTKDFDKYLNDNKVIKFGGWHGKHFLHSETSLIIFFAFFHSSIKNLNGSQLEKRILLNAFPESNYQGPLPLQLINTEQYILVNADHSEYAILFKVSIDIQGKKIKLTLEDSPELGHSIISDVEKNGMVVEVK